MAGVLHRRRQRRGDVSPDVGERLQLAHRGRGGHRRVGGQAPPYGPPGESVSESTTVGGGGLRPDILVHPSLGTFSQK